MMTWKSVDLPEAVLPAKSACWRVPFADREYLLLGRAGAADWIRSSCVVSFVQY
jgi:hypothetical protein